MKKSIVIYLSLLIFSLAFISCSEVQSDITPPSPISLHKEGVNNPASPNFHGKLVAQMKWDLKYCQQCHAVNYTGGTAKASCLDCHRQPGGPEACNTCHGDFADPFSIAPPRDLSGGISETSRGVGAHTKHLGGNSLGSVVECSVCHKVPRGYSDVGHIDDSPSAEINFTGLAVKGTTSANQPVYNYNQISCSNTYCHGNFSYSKSESSYSFAYTQDAMIGNNSNPVWNKVDGTYVKCNSCHGKSEIDPSPVGHINASLTNLNNNPCANCHPGVVDYQGRIIDKEKHINGKINVFNIEIDR
jgi:predicted CxxxxCH...CXXCH cytochrome family protein